MRTSHFILGLLAIAGIALASRPRMWVRVPCTLFLLFILLHVLLHGDARYRLPVTPLIALLAGGGIASLLSLLRGSSRLTRSGAWEGGLMASAFVAAYGITGWMLLNGKIN